MAARVVMLTFADNKAAEEFARNMIATEDQPADVVIPAGTAMVDAMIARPSKPCVHGVAVKGFSRVPRFGWFVCPECKRPTKAVVRNWMANHLNGCVNLLHELFPDRAWAQPMWHDETEPYRKLTERDVTPWRPRQKLTS